MSRNSIETTPSSLSPIKIKSSTVLTIEKLRELSRPKLKIGNYEEMVGPGSYEPREGFLSTKCKSPSAAIGRSERFLKVKILEMKKSARKYEEQSDLSAINYNLSEVIAPPRYTFKRTGHNLTLVKNPGNPGVGSYSTPSPRKNQTTVFAKAVKDFNWKKGKR
jgi:hypothetical protein